MTIYRSLRSNAAFAARRPCADQICLCQGRSLSFLETFADCRAEKKVTRRLEKVYRRSRSTADRLLWSSQFNHQRSSFQQKLRDYWLTTINSCGKMLDCCGLKYGTALSPPPQRL